MGVEKFMAEQVARAEAQSQWDPVTVCASSSVGHCHTKRCGAIGNANSPKGTSHAPDPGSLFDGMDPEMVAKLKGIRIAGKRLFDEQGNALVV